MRSDNTMEITVREEGAVMILALSGELDAVNSPRLDHAIADLLAEGRRQFLIDLIAVSFVDSSGLSALVRGLKRVRTGAGTLRLAGLQPGVRKVFELTRLD